MYQPRLGSVGLIVLLAGCGSVDPAADYEETSSWVAARTGAGLQAPTLEQPLRGANPASLDGLLAGGVTLEDARRIALINNAELRARLLSIGVSRADVAQAGLPPNPSLSISAAWAKGNLYQLAGSLLPGIFDLFLIPGRIDAAEGHLQATKLDVAHAAVVLVADVTGAFYDVLSLQQAQSLGQETLGLAERSVSVAEGRFAAGLADRASVDLERTELLVVRQGLLSLELERAVAQAELLRLLGLARSSRPLTLVGALPGPWRSGGRSLRSPARPSPRRWGGLRATRSRRWPGCGSPRAEPAPKTSPLAKRS